MKAEILSSVLLMGLAVHLLVVASRRKVRRLLWKMEMFLLR